MSQKTTYGQGAQDISTRLAVIFQEAANLHAVYFDRGYNSGGANPITDDDVSGLTCDAADIVAFITMAEQLENFRSNAAVVTGDYDATVNAMRTDV